MKPLMTLPLSKPRRRRWQSFLFGCLVGAGMVALLGCEQKPERQRRAPPLADFPIVSFRDCHDACGSLGLVVGLYRNFDATEDDPRGNVCRCQVDLPITAHR